MYTLIKVGNKLVLDRTRCWYETLFNQTRDWFIWHMKQMERKGVVELDFEQLVQDLAKSQDIYGYEPYHMSIPADVHEWADVFVEWYASQ